MDVIQKADLFASVAHAAIGQKRKYSGVDYIVHPRRVSKIVADAGGTEATHSRHLRPAASSAQLSATSQHAVAAATMLAANGFEENMPGNIPAQPKAVQHWERQVGMEIFTTQHAIFSNSTNLYMVCNSPKFGIPKKSMEVNKTFSVDF